jgi:hypothetical protein
MGRIYRITFEQVATTGPVDLVSIKGASGKLLRILHRWVGCTDTTIPTAQMLAIRERFASATLTLGSGGTASPTIAALDPGDAAASFTAHTNDTSKATTSGAFTTIFDTGVHLFNGYDDETDVPNPIGPNEGYVFELLSTPSGTVHLSGGVTVEEIGG